jgi:hypothetical protein
MELDDFKSYYAQTGKHEKDKETLMEIVRSGNPVSKSIRKQLIIESVLFTGFLLVYYDFFDGHLKPLFWNILLVLAIVLVLVHNVLSYFLINKPVNGPDIQLSLKRNLQRIRNYSILSIASRVTAIIIISGYFLTTVRWNERKYWIIGFILLLICIQVYILGKIWLCRINRIKAVHTQLV